MDTQTLRATLAQLHTQLAQVPSLDAPSRQLLMQVMQDAQRLIDRAASAPESSVAPVSPVADERRLEALAVQFESEHPTLAASVRQFIDVLAQGGL